MIAINGTRLLSKYESQSKKWHPSIDKTSRHNGSIYYGNHLLFFNVFLSHVIFKFQAFYNIFFLQISFRLTLFL